MKNNNFLFYIIFINSISFYTLAEQKFLKDIQPLNDNDKCFIYTFHNNIFIPNNFQISKHVNYFNFTIKTVNFKYTETLTKKIINDTILYSGKNVCIDSNFKGSFGKYALYDHYFVCEDPECNSVDMCSEDTVKTNLLYDDIAYDDIIYDDIGHGYIISHGYIEPVTTRFLDILYIFDTTIDEHKLNIQKITYIIFALFSNNNIYIRSQISEKRINFTSYKNETIFNIIKHENISISLKQVNIFLLNSSFVDIFLYGKDHGLGFAYFADICKDKKIAVARVDYERIYESSTDIATTIFHEILHVFGIKHDLFNCNCFNDKNYCIMDKFHSSVDLFGFHLSDCTRIKLDKILKNINCLPIVPKDEIKYFRLNEYVAQNDKYIKFSNISYISVYDKYKNLINIPKNYIIDLVDNEQYDNIKY